MYTYDISFPEHAEKIIHPDHLLTTHCPVHLGELVILSDGSGRKQQRADSGADEEGLHGGDS